MAEPNSGEENALRLKAIIDSAIDGIITIDERGTVETFNPAAGRIFGYDPSEVIGQNVRMLMEEPHHSGHDQYLRNYLNTGEKKIIGIGREVQGRRKDGSTFPFLLSISEARMPSGKRVFAGIVHELTRIRLAEDKLRRYAADLERSNQELEDFAYVTSHDLQEPLRKIQAFGDIVRGEEREQLSDQGRDYIDRMLNAASRMQKLINALLSYSRLTSQARPFEKVDLGQVLQGVLSDLEVRIREADAIVTHDLLPTLDAEPIQMQQLLQNLIGNAIKFRHPDRAPRIHITVILQTLEGKSGDGSTRQLVQLLVKDNGIGFDQKYADRIFTIFQRLEGKRYEGTGVGLAICKKIALRHGGNLKATSSPGKGSTFKVTLERTHGALTK